jgi:hypothetical protein
MYLDLSRLEKILKCKIDGIDITPLDLGHEFSVSENNSYFYIHSDGYALSGSERIRHKFPVWANNILSVYFDGDRVSSATLRFSPRFLTLGKFIDNCKDPNFVAQFFPKILYKDSSDQPQYYNVDDFRRLSISTEFTNKYLPKIEKIDNKWKLYQSSA